MGKILDRTNDQWVYLERYVKLLSIRVVRGCLKIAESEDMMAGENSFGTSNARYLQQSQMQQHQTSCNQTPEHLSSKYSPYLTSSQRQTLSKGFHAATSQNQ